MRKEIKIKHYTQRENGGRDANEKDVGGIPKMRELEKVVSQPKCTEGFKVSVT